MTSVRLGSVEIISLLDVQFSFPISGVFPGVPAEQWRPYWEQYPQSGRDGQYKSNTLCYVVVTPTERILVDTGLGPGPHAILGGAGGNLLAELREEQIEPESIDRVVFTHLHGDHVGWNLQDGVATFPRARYLVPEADWDHFRSADHADGNPAFAEQVAPLEALGRMELVSGETTLTPELTLLPTPGHTPGHQSVLVSSGGERAIILGDLIHHPAQVEQVEWTPRFDVDPPTTIATRRRVMERLEVDGSLVAACHLPYPGFGHVVRLEGTRVFRAL